MMWLATMMVVIAAQILIELETASVMKKTKMKSVNSIGQIAAQTGNQLEIRFAMLKTIIKTVILMEEIVVLVGGLEMVFVKISTIIQGVVPMMEVIAVWMTQSQTGALIVDAMKMVYPSAM